MSYFEIELELIFFFNSSRETGRKGRREQLQ